MGCAGSGVLGSGGQAGYAVSRQELTANEGEWQSTIMTREDQERLAGEKLETLLLESLNSGEPVEVTPEYWERKRAHLIERHATKTGTRWGFADLTHLSSQQTV